MNKILTLIALTVTLFTGCATTGDGGMSDGDVALLAQDIRDVAHAGTVYALAENPEWRVNITRVRDQILIASGDLSDPITFDSLISVLQGLPLKELKSSEALLVITGLKITLRRAGRNVELGNIASIRPIAQALADGISDGLATVNPQAMAQ